MVLLHSSLLAHEKTDTTVHTVSFIDNFVEKAVRDLQAEQRRFETSLIGEPTEYQSFFLVLKLSNESTVSRVSETEFFVFAETYTLTVASLTHTCHCH